MKGMQPDTHIIRSIAAAALGGSIVVDLVEEGVSTQVYRLGRGAETFYLRVLPEVGATFAPEAHAHTLLRRQGVRVPEVVYWEERGSILDIVRDNAALLDSPHAYLAHGDFDATHIYCQDGRYTGIIDLGEIRGTGPFYDLGHFRFHDGETVQRQLLPYLLDGYREVTPLPSDIDRRIAFNSLLIGVHFLGRTHTRLARHSREHAVIAIERDLEFLDDMSA